MFKLKNSSNHNSSVNKIFNLSILISVFSFLAIFLLSLLVAKLTVNKNYAESENFRIAGYLLLAIIFVLNLIWRWSHKIVTNSFIFITSIINIPLQGIGFGILFASYKHVDLFWMFGIFALIFLVYWLSNFVIQDDRILNASLGIALSVSIIIAVIGIALYFTHTLHSKTIFVILCSVPASASMYVVIIYLWILNINDNDNAIAQKRRFLAFYTFRYSSDTFVFPIIILFAIVIGIASLSMMAWGLLLSIFDPGSYESMGPAKPRVKRVKKVRENNYAQKLRQQKEEEKQRTVDLFKDVNTWEKKSSTNNTMYEVDDSNNLKF